MAIYCRIFVLGAVLSTFNVISTMRVQDFFPNIKGNLTKVTWAHAVNNKTYLEDTLKDNSIMMIEADIVLGKLNDKGDDIPIMGHPPTKSSDLSLDQFLSIIQEFNSQSNQTITRKGVKLDFKTAEVFKISEKTVSKYKDVNYPVWINADILPGTIIPPPAVEPVDPAEFLPITKTFQDFLLSTGWTTFHKPGLNGQYTNQGVERMANTLKDYDITQEVTFPVRAVWAAHSLNELKSLLVLVPNSTLTIWSAPIDIDVDVAKLRTLIKTIGVQKIYIDVPEELRKGLHLDNL